MTYVEVAIAKQHTGNKFFSYQTEELVTPGQIVRVPFGRSNTMAVILGIVKKPTFATKNITALFPFTLPETSLNIMRWMYEFYPDDYGLITQLFIPASFVVSPKKTPPKSVNGKAQPLPKPTKEQAIALKILSDPKTTRALLHGDTGTGKTRVFTELINQSITQGKSVLVLTPEIGLTPQLVDDIVRHAQAPVIVTHSNMTPVARRRVWEHAALASKPTVYVGPRSALFLPYQSLGLIVVDEAHDSSYKQAQSPRYQSLHIASQLASAHGAKLIQSTATPNVDDYYIAEKAGYQIIRMTEPAAGSLASTTEIIDLTNRDSFTQNPYLSNQLITAIHDALNHNQQAMLFLNRRGSARLVQCASCGWQALCPRCGIPLTYHHDQHTLRCHSCGYKTVTPASCPDCSATELSFKSIGTKSLTEQVQRLFPKARIMRFDADSTASEQLHRNVSVLKNGEVDIVIGTQLISKGIDLPNLSVVGVINADSGLNLPDYRAEEMTFQQLYQVTGRVGRGHTLSKSFVQTRLPENPVLQAVLHRSWHEFYDYEISKRQRFQYPPFKFIAVSKSSRKSLKGAELQAQKVANQLSHESGLGVLGPSPSFYEKRADMYTWQTIIKSAKRSRIVQAVRNLSPDTVTDIDPTSLL
ncbi:MAG: primosomal protein N' [Candidatus Saccharimonadales bacterium]